MKKATLKSSLKNSDGKLLNTAELGEATIKEKEDNKTVQFDQTLSMLLPMLTTQGDSGSGKSNDMMLPLVLLMTQGTNSGFFRQQPFNSTNAINEQIAYLSVKG